LAYLEAIHLFVEVLGEWGFVVVTTAGALVGWLTVVRRAPLVVFASRPRLEIVKRSRYRHNLTRRILSKRLRTRPRVLILQGEKTLFLHASRSNPSAASPSS
jgi:hypothetical protein